ncbi:MAG: demethylmenaquinone methyltransferase / 2-methoxy-6-polyprenyl,4-benzoquinol methylase [Bradyrhizobium sp.]|jgi:ubiquinone/menaquinone biosynthesis C-methylase UbiE/chorismate mutase|nr:demethylmenaquinone methyltransferase / 2-methoxy-6-polyprenyl,4-benzoquinol methylase [Bradyrhizobium sp.]
MPDLKTLGEDFVAVDRLIMDLIKRRMDLAQLVAREKLRDAAAKKATESAKPGKAQVDGNYLQIYNRERELERLNGIKAHADRIGLDSDFAQAILYLLFGESIKEQVKLLQNTQQLDLETAEDKDRQAQLRQNLVELTEYICEKYDPGYTEVHHATDAYGKFEAELLAADSAKLKRRKLALDLGCGTGSLALELATRHGFEQVRGYDLSEDMISVANRKRKQIGAENVIFERRDIEAGEFPADTGSVSYVVMNMGTASDMVDLPKMLATIGRILEPGGRFFLSFHNADALLYESRYLPWPTSLAAAYNSYTNCLDVRHRERVFSIFTQPHSEETVRRAMPAALNIDDVTSYPVLSSILPNDLFTSLTPETIDEIDRGLAKSDRSSALSSAGAYLIVSGKKGE